MKSIEWEYCRKVFGAECENCDNESNKENYSEKVRAVSTEEILDFANMVFSMAYGSTDFAALLPKAYSRERSGIPVHHMILEENRLRALIDLYPVSLYLQGESSALKASYVGTVSVHPHSQGKGYMNELMRKAEEDARGRGCALMILDGDRHRYQHYGFERAGIRYTFRIETGNIRHCCASMYQKESLETAAFHFEELAEDSPYNERMFELYQQRLVTARSREDFWLCLQSYNAKAYAVLRGDDIIGYVNLSESGDVVSEFEIIEKDIERNDRNRNICRLLYDLMSAFGVEQLQVSVGMDELDKIAELEKACDTCSISMSHQIKILDYEAVLGFLLKWKQKYDTPVNGEYVLGVRDEQTGRIESYLLSVAASGVSVSRTEDAADTILGKMELVRLLTTNLCDAEQHKGTQNKLKNAPAGWFPLPFYLPEADTF